ncbi:MAG: hypothetical protein BWY92_00904 [Firmicutes bacterium ADurb.BinA052]|nr:MAG: hypothetical protein BWY92_00904 [Firmicutes bacterium ADurb.BinA052]
MAMSDTGLLVLTSSKAAWLSFRPTMYREIVLPVTLAKTARECDSEKPISCATCSGCMSSATRFSMKSSADLVAIE